MKKIIYGLRAQTDQLTVRSFTPDLKSYNAENRSVDAVLATDAIVRVLDIANWRMVDEVLQMDGVRLPKQVPLIDTHDRSSIMRIAGSTRDFRIEGGKLYGTRYFAKSELGNTAEGLVRDGHLTDGSIGYRIDKFVMIDPGKSKTVQGRNYTAGENPLRIVPRWTLIEDSLTAVGADAGAKMRSSTNVGNPTEFLQEILTMKRKKEFCDWLTKRAMNFDELTEEQRTALYDDFVRAVPENPTAPTAPANPTAEPTRTALADAELDRIRKEAVNAELTRQARIRELAGADVPETILKRCLDDARCTVETAQGLFLDAIRKSKCTINTPQIMVTNHQMNRSMLEAALMLRNGYEGDIVKLYGEQTANQADRIRTDLSLIDLCRNCLTLDHQDIPNGRDNQIRAAMSTYSLPYVLGNVANKAALKGYNTPNATWRKWCSIGSAADFKTMTRTRLTDAGDLQAVPNSGEIAHGSAVEEYEQFAIATYAKQFGITRKDIINDDQSMFTKVPENMGRKAMNKVSNLVYTHLLANGNMTDAIALFSATTHLNLNTSSALAEATVEQAIYKFLEQVDKDGQSINVMPRFLLVPPALWFTALRIVKSGLRITARAGATDANTVIGDANVTQGLLEPIAEPLLANSTITGYSATTWYVMGSPSEVDTIEVAFLDGKDAPTVERIENDPNILGLRYRVYIDAGCKALDFRGMQKNTA